MAVGRRNAKSCQTSTFYRTPLSAAPLRAGPRSNRRHGRENGRLGLAGPRSARLREALIRNTNTNEQVVLVFLDQCLTLSPAAGRRAASKALLSGLRFFGSSVLRVTVGALGATASVFRVPRREGRR